PHRERPGVRPGDRCAGRSGGRATSSLAPALFGLDRYVRGELDLVAQAVLHVDGLVLAVGAEEAEKHRQPPHPPDLFLEDRASEDDLASAELVVVALGLLDSVDVDGDRWLCATRQPNPAAGGDAPLRNVGLASHRRLQLSASRTASKAVSSSADSSRRLRMTPEYGTSAPSPITSMPTSRPRRSPPVES